MTDQQRNRIIAALVTILVGVALGLMLWLVRLSAASRSDAVWPPQDSSELLLAGEFVEVEALLPPPESGGSSDPDDGATPPPPDAHDMVNSGTPAPETTPVITSNQPSTVTEKPRQPQQPTGPSQAEIEARQREQRQKEASDEAKNRVQFGKTPAADGTGSGTTGTGAGESTSKGSHKGSVGNGLSGRTVTVSTTPTSTIPGRVVVRIKVDRTGRQTTAPTIVAAQTTIADAAVRQACLAAASKAKVSAREDAEAEQSGTITFNFK